MNRDYSLTSDSSLNRTKKYIYFEINVPTYFTISQIALK